MPFVILVLPFFGTFLVLLVTALFPPSRFRFSQLLTVLGPVLVLSVEIVLLWQPSANSQNAAFVFTSLDRLFLSVLLGLTALAMLAAYSTGFLASGRFSPATLATAGTVIAALYINNLFLTALLFVLAGFFSIVAVVDVDSQEEERFVRAVKAAVRYLVATVLFGLALFIALIFLERLRLDPQLTGLIKIVVALAVVGFALRLAVFPFNLWLPDVLEEAPGLAGFVLVGLVNVSAVAFLMDFLQKNPSLVFDNYAEAQVVMTAAMTGAGLAALLALGQNGLGKTLAYTASADFGLILFGLVAPHRTGLNGALYESLNLALAHLLIFTSLAVATYCVGGRSLNTLTGLGRRLPVTAIGLAVGVMAMAGLPMLSGFAGKYLILQSAAQEGLVWALAGGLTVGLAAVAYFRYFHRIFTGPDVPGLKTLPEPTGAILLILGLVALVILLGLWPAPLLSWLDTALRSSTA